MVPKRQTVAARSGKSPVQAYLLGEDVAVLQAAAQPVATLEIQQICWTLAASLRGQPGIIEVVPGMNNLSVRFDIRRYDPEQMLSALQQQWQTQSTAANPVSHTASAARLVQIPVQYGGQDGPDLELVAAHCGMSPAQVIAAHSEAEYRVYFLGFQPGFAYLGGLPESLVTPRRAEPRLSVPAGSVGIGGAQTGIYPAASPGGWQLIGRTALSLFDPARAEPSLLQSGDLVRFVPVTQGVADA
ncbi:5-oxoprolinase subunit PxpB [Undibacterium curvum]|uniref:5-oxoprolinase subunit PxpB n=1 Tax=Undibacterium curvum TaxID=2762294 RepID=A0ABR7A8G6_9BURK|nr:5-oxoprolinase subunit PxpB [Undibacterium curvum]MBC3933103.1 5-oxoprolinase subunit PxpB [Undibacterium curvum]